MDTVEELKQKLEQAVAAVTQAQDEAARYKAKAAEQLDVQKKAQQHAEDQKRKAEEAEAEAAAKSGDLDKLKAQHAADLQKLQDKIDARDKELSEIKIDGGIRAQIAEANIAPQFHKAVFALARVEAALDGEGNAVIGGKPVADYFKAFVASDEGKHYVSAPLNVGGNASGPKTTGPIVQTNVTRTEYLRLVRDDPARAAIIAEKNGW